MNKYRVFIYFNVYRVNPFLSPSRIIELEMPEGSIDSDIIHEALKQLDYYPRTYSASVVQVPSAVNSVPRFVILAGKTEGFEYKDGHTVGADEEEVEPIIEQLKEKGYTQFIVTTVVKTIYK